MAQLCGSFLIRVWRLGDAQRFAIEHIQTGEKTLAISVADAMDWICAHTAASGDPSTTTAESVTEQTRGNVDGEEGVAMPDGTR